MPLRKSVIFLRGNKEKFLKLWWKNRVFSTTPDNSPPGSRRKAPVGGASKATPAGNPAVWWNTRCVTRKAPQGCGAINNRDVVRHTDVTLN